jgi:phospholipid-binding lipoprotein MlaA
MRNLTFCHLVACATLFVAQPAAAQATGDPLEGLNRRIHAFNRDVQVNILDPMAELYIAATTTEVRRGVRNSLANLREPITAVSGLAAGEFALALNATVRFGINSTIGLAGVHDRAATMGYPRHSFGVADAVCRWGVPSGPFVVLPLLGPSTLRDAGALVATSAALAQTLGPDVYFTWLGTDALVRYAHLHEGLARIDAQSLDTYAVHRSAYLQRRAAVCTIDRGRDAAGPAEDEPRTP